MPDLTDRARRRLEEGATAGAGTDVCTKCDGPKEPHRVNSDRCGRCNGVKKKMASRTVLVHAVRFEPTTEMFLAMQAQAAARSMTLADYVTDSMRRVLRKDTGETY